MEGHLAGASNHQLTHRHLQPITLSANIICGIVCYMDACVYRLQLID